MKILIVAPEQIPVPGSGSVEICILAIAKQLAKKHKVTVLSRASKGLPAQSSEGGVTIVRVPSGSSKVYIASVLHFIQGKFFDVIQVDNRPHYMASIQKKFPKMKVTLFLHSLTFVPPANNVARYLRQAKLIIANSSSLKQKLVNRFPGVAQKIHTVELGVDTGRFCPATTADRSRYRNQFGIEDKYTALFVGRVIPRKGIPVLLKAASYAGQEVPLQVVIAGRGRASYVKQLRALASKLNVSVKWLGKQKHSNIHKIYGIADCLVCPSQKHEAFGLVNVEAMASGLPVIASKIGGIPEIVKHEHNGFLVDDYSRAERFAQYLIKLGKNKKMGQEMGVRGRSDVIDNFTWGLTADRLLSLYLQR
ncbi:glycosyltransferase family 4 protein [Paenibacillus lentus]|uniref:Glycosyltransferase family 1 protein n=1 Tax=Paenibacillus lentus TaxID=1338368 RepID=A0A3S8RWV9_9BACL|nr:glycosyltransferase family 4 protein [Paenibacillus lentus]AZK47561.1 glycosyltransferase family 1 protein [Paenibacillus lentus]